MVIYQDHKIYDTAIDDENESSCTSYYAVHCSYYISDFTSNFDTIFVDNNKLGIFLKQMYKFCH